MIRRYIALAGAVALTAILVPSAALAAPAGATPDASQHYDLINYNYGGALTASSSTDGAQVDVTGGSADNFILVNPVSDCEIPPGETCYEIKDTTYDRCLKADTGIAGIPVVEYGCDTSGDVTQQQEEWAVPGSGDTGWIPNEYATIDTQPSTNLCEHSSGWVWINNTAGPPSTGFEWYMDPVS